VKVTYSIDSREEWLQSAVELIAHGQFKPAGYTVPPLHVSMGFPAGTRKSGDGKAIGQCWYAENSEDGKAHVFITPTLKHTGTIVATLIHEMVHVTVGSGKGHGPVFKRCALAVGLTGKMTATVSTPELAQWIEKNILDVLGEFPHARIKPGMGIKKQSTRMIKCVCFACGYVARTSAKWIVEVGAPLCPCNSEPMVEG
jgi:hypothetical protein